jgi:hypothetical protein
MNVNTNEDAKLLRILTEKSGNLYSSVVKISSFGESVFVDAYACRQPHINNHRQT